MDLQRAQRLVEDTCKKLTELKSELMGLETVDSTPISGEMSQTQFVEMIISLINELSQKHVIHANVSQKRMMKQGYENRGSFYVGPTYTTITLSYYENSLRKR
jgi:hypothetical protein